MFIAGTYRSGCVSFLVDGTRYDEEAEKNAQIVFFVKGILIFVKKCRMRCIPTVLIGFNRDCSSG